MSRQTDIDGLMQYGVDPVGRTIFCTAFASEGGDGEGGVNWEMADRVLKGLYLLERSSALQPINLIINNYGGDDEHCLAIYGALRNCESPIVGTVYGRAQSAAAWILQACDMRRMDRHSHLMVHAGEGSKTRHSRHLDDLFVRILLERIQQKMPEYTKAKLVNKLHEDWYLYPTQAVEWGLADEVIG